MKTTQLYIDDFGLDATDRSALLNTGGTLRNLKDDSVIGTFHGVLSPSPVGNAIRNRVYNSLRNPRPDDVSTVLLKNLRGTVVTVKGKATWLESQKLEEANKELTDTGKIEINAAVGLKSALFSNSVVGQEPIVVTNNVISPKTTDSYSAYLVKNKRLWVAAVVIDIAGTSCYTIPTPYCGVYYYKSKGGTTDGNTGVIKPWSFPNISDKDGISVTAYSMDLPLAGQVISSNQAKGGGVAANYVVESDVITNSLKKENKQQVIIYVPYEILQDASTANQGPIKFVKSGDVYNSVSSGTAGNGVQISKDNVLITADGDTISSTNTSDIKVPIIKGDSQSNGKGARFEAFPNLLEVGVAAAAGILGAKLITRNSEANDNSETIDTEFEEVPKSKSFVNLFKQKDYEL